MQEDVQCLRQGRDQHPQRSWNWRVYQQAAHERGCAMCWLLPLSCTFRRRKKFQTPISRRPRNILLPPRWKKLDVMEPVVQFGLQGSVENLKTHFLFLGICKYGVEPK